MKAQAPVFPQRLSLGLLFALCYMVLPKPLRWQVVAVGSRDQITGDDRVVLFVGPADQIGFPVFAVLAVDGVGL